MKQPYERIEDLERRMTEVEERIEAFSPKSVKKEHEARGEQPKR
jgi:hypothetical protein